MQNSTKLSSSHVFDYAVIGGGLSGLCVANALNQITENVILIDGSDFLGGVNRAIQTPQGTITNGLRFMPNTELAHKAVSFIEKLIQKSVIDHEINEAPVTFEGGALKPFLGFGSQPPAFYDEISYFASQGYLQLQSAPHEWINILHENFRGHYSPRSHVTRFVVENGHIAGVIVNGQKTIHAQNVIYCGAVKNLKTLFPEGSVSQRVLAKLSKNSYWTSVCLDLIHCKPVTESRAIHILNGTTQDEIGPCAGIFKPANENGTQLSQWITFVDDEESEDTEIIATALKKIKRQIKRAYPKALDALVYERILVVPSFAGNGDLKLSANQSVPGIENLWVASPQVHPQKNILGALLQAELVASALGCHPAGTQVTVETPEANL